MTRNSFPYLTKIAQKKQLVTRQNKLSPTSEADEIAQKNPATYMLRERQLAKRHRKAFAKSERTYDLTSDIFGKFITKELAESKVDTSSVIKIAGIPVDSSNKVYFQVKYWFDYC